MILIGRVFQDILQNELQIVGKIPFRQMGSVVLVAGVHIEVNGDDPIDRPPKVAVDLPE